MASKMRRWRQAFTARHLLLTLKVEDMQHLSKMLSVRHAQTSADDTSNSRMGSISTVMKGKETEAQTGTGMCSGLALLHRRDVD